MFTKIKDFFKEIILTIGPIIFIVTILQFTLVKMPWMMYLRFLLGAFMVIIGLTLLLKGLKIGLVPVGEMIGSAMTSKGSVTLLLFLGFLIGFAVTIAEPDVIVLSTHVNTVSSGQIDKLLLVSVIGIGVGFFILISFLRVLLKIPIIYILLGGYLTILILSFFTKGNYIPIGFDAGGVTTGPVTVPFIMALGMGFVYSLGGRSRTSEGFGYIGLASIGPIISVMILGVIYN
ncbi:MAG: DUF1538 domain-containing protein [Actinomycetota bacterium]|nr:DUF1538 domain-containing protein [Actinomycetota bacterium]